METVGKNENGRVVSLGRVFIHLDFLSSASPVH